MATAAWSDFISDFMEFTESALSPVIFRKWSAISLVAGALERRVWLKMGSRRTFGNLYVLLVAHPGVGKYTVEVARDMWTQACQPGTKTPAFKVAPDNMSKASLMDRLAKAKQMFIPPSGPPATYHSLLIAAEEFSVLLPAYDLEYIGALNSIYNNKTVYEESRRTGSVRELAIEYPQLNILAGVQPGWLASVFPEEAWSTGLASRLIMVYSADTPLKDLFSEEEESDALRARLLAKLGQMSALYGQMQWEPAAAKRVGEWHLAGGPPTPTHSKLAHYLRRRTSLHMPKLAMVSAIAGTGRLIVRDEDVIRAIGWLTEAEALMPDIFRSMVGKSDMQMIEEMHYFLSAVYAKENKPVHSRLLVNFLAQRVPSDKVEKIIDIAERSNIIARIAGTDNYIPKARYEHGIE